MLGSQAARLGNAFGVAPKRTAPGTKRVCLAVHHRCMQQMHFDMTWLLLAGGGAACLS